MIGFRRSHRFSLVCCALDLIVLQKLSLTKQKLMSLADGLIIANPQSIGSCIDFIETDTRGVWHNRARAIMCRRLKHVELSAIDSDRVVKAILGKLKSGDFSEQFRDMLKLAAVLDPTTTQETAESLLCDKREFVRREAKWIVDRGSSQDSTTHGC